MSQTDDCLVTIIVSPRERFSVSARSLDSIYEHTDAPFDLIYVDGGSPRYVRDYLARAAAERGFKLIRSETFLSPNHARNLALRHARTRYVVFIDNDVVVSPGWLTPLIACAEETGAAIVGPLICQGSPLHSIVHCAGGACGVREIESHGKRERHLFEKIFSQGKSVAKLAPTLRRQPTHLAEFHCMVVRLSGLREIGPLDERILSTREHIDFCMLVAERGGAIYFEPASVVTYLNNARMRLSDLHYYMLRWSDAWERTSLIRMAEKWNLSTDGTLGFRLKHVGWRRRSYLIRPLVRSLGLGPETAASKLIVRGLVILDRRLNAAIDALHRRSDRIGRRLGPQRLR
jgi:GT2 family glycosyltransferase